MIDDKSFFGGVLHVCYAPELETLSETKYKLDQRRWDIAKRIRKYSNKYERYLRGKTKQGNEE